MAEKAKVYFTDFRTDVGTSLTKKLQRLCLAAGLKTIELEGKTFKALQEVRVSVNGAEPVELYPRDRDMVKVVGPAFSLRVEIEDPGSDVELVEREVRVGFGKDLMLSFPLMATSRDFILPPPASQQTPAPEAAASEDALAPGAGEEVPAVPANP